MPDKGAALSRWNVCQFRSLTSCWWQWAPSILWPGSVQCPSRRSAGATLAPRRWAAAGRTGGGRRSWPPATACRASLCRSPKPRHSLGKPGRGWEEGGRKRGGGSKETSRGWVTDVSVGGVWPHADFCRKQTQLLFCITRAEPWVAFLMNLQVTRSLICYIFHFCLLKVFWNPAFAQGSFHSVLFWSFHNEAVSSSVSGSVLNMQCPKSSESHQSEGFWIISHRATHDNTVWVCSGQRTNKSVFLTTLKYEKPHQNRFVSPNASQTARNLTC